MTAIVREIDTQSIDNDTNNDDGDDNDANHRQK